LSPHGRAFRIERGKDKRWTLYRVEEIGAKGDLLGTYKVAVMRIRH